jgi:hypothetical protein
MTAYDLAEIERTTRANEAHLDILTRRIVNLEQQVANQAVAMEKINVRVPVTGYPDMFVKGQAAQQQATQHRAQPREPVIGHSDALYAPLRSDTKPLLEMSAFVRRVAQINPDHASYSTYSSMRELVETAKEILKRST